MTVEVKLFIAQEFTDLEKANIINGVLMWERATMGTIYWTVAPLNMYNEPWEIPGKYVVIVKKVNSQESLVTSWDKAHDGRWLVGLTAESYGVATIWLVEDRLVNSSMETVVAAHEFGHSMGLRHIPDGDSIMNESYEPGHVCLNRDDLVEFCRKFQCDVNKMRWCD